MSSHPIASVLFVCLGNICRSPLAEAAFRRAAEERDLNVLVDSAGTGDWHIGNAPDPRARATASRYGCNIDGYRARQVCAEDFRRFSYIIALDATNLKDLRRLAPKDTTAAIALFMDYVPGHAGESVADPYFGDLSGFEQTWDEVCQGAAALADHIQRSSE